MQDISDDMVAPAADALRRRKWISSAGVGAIALGSSVAAAMAALPAASAQAQGVTDVAIGNFALNFEYLGAELYSRALTGQGLAATDTTGGNGAASGGVIGGRPVSFATPAVQQLIAQFAKDELGHVRTLRTTLGANAIAEPTIDLQNSFRTAAATAGLGNAFDPFADENSLLLASFVLEDVCVTALRGAGPLIQSKAVLAVASGFLAVEGYQASAVRLLLSQRGYGPQTVAVSNLRASLSGAADDQGVVLAGAINIVPTDSNSLTYARTPRQVLNIAYGAPNAAAGGFFPNGVNGTIR